MRLPSRLPLLYTQHPTQTPDTPAQDAIPSEIRTRTMRSETNDGTPSAPPQRFHLTLPKPRDQFKSVALRRSTIDLARQVSTVLGTLLDGESVCLGGEHNHCLFKKVATQTTGAQTVLRGSWVLHMSAHSFLAPKDTGIHLRHLPPTTPHGTLWPPSLGSLTTIISHFDSRPKSRPKKRSAATTHPHMLLRAPSSLLAEHLLPIPQAAFPAGRVVSTPRFSPNWNNEAKQLSTTQTAVQVKNATG